MEYLDKIRQHFKDTQRDSFFYFYPLAEGLQGKGKFSSSNVRESLELGLQTIVTSYSTHIHWSRSSSTKQTKLIPNVRFFQSSKEVQFAYFLTYLRNPDASSPKFRFLMWFLFLPWLTKDSTSFLGTLYPELSHQEQMAMNMWSNLFF